MKKIAAILLAMLLLLAGCGGKQPVSTSTPDANRESDQSEVDQSKADQSDDEKEAIKQLLSKGGAILT